MLREETPVVKLSPRSLHSNNIQNNNLSNYFVFEPYKTGINETEFNCVFCCCDFGEEIIFNEAYDENTTKKDIVEKLTEKESSSSKSFVYSLISITLLISSCSLLVIHSFKIWGAVPFIGTLTYTGMGITSLCLGFSIYFLINTYIWIVYVEVKYLLVNLFMFLISIGLIVASIILCQSKEINTEGYHGIANHFDKNNTVIPKP